MAASTVRKGKICAATNCRNYYCKQGLSFFRLPRQEDRCLKWVANARLQHLLKPGEMKLAKPASQLNISHCMCAVHFEDSEFTNCDRNRLNWNAIPTLFDIPDPPPLLNRKRPSVTAATNQPSMGGQHDKDGGMQLKKSGVSMSTTPETSSTSTTVVPVTTPAVTVQTENGQPVTLHIGNDHTVTVQIVDDKPKTFQSVKTVTNMNSVEGSSTVIPQDTTVHMPQPSSNPQKVIETPRERTLRLAKNCAQRQVSRLKLKLKRMNKRVGNKKQCIDMISKYLSGRALSFVASQIRQSGLSATGRRWTSEDKAMALSIYGISPKCYQLLSTVFALPNKKSLFNKKPSGDLTQPLPATDAQALEVLAEWCCGDVHTKVKSEIKAVTRSRVISVPKTEYYRIKTGYEPCWNNTISEDEKPDPGVDHSSPNTEDNRNKVIDILGLDGWRKLIEHGQNTRKEGQQHNMCPVYTTKKRVVQSYAVEYYLSAVFDDSRASCPEEKKICCHGFQRVGDTCVENDAADKAGDAFNFLTDLGIVG